MQLLLFKKKHVKIILALLFFLFFFIYDIFNDTSVMLLCTKMFLAGPYK